MENFRRNNRSSGRRDNRSFNDRDSKRPEMYKAVCDECGKDCEVPFKPSRDKPVYCSDCFRSKGNSEPRRSGGKNFGRSDFGEKRMYEVICDKCGKKCEVPFKPSGDKPIYCSECFKKVDKNKSFDKPNKQFEVINDKLDKILKLLIPTVSTKVSEEKKVMKKIVEKPVKKIVEKPIKKIVEKPVKKIVKSKKISINKNKKVVPLKKVKTKKKK